MRNRHDNHRSDKDEWAELALLLERLLHEQIGLTEGCREISRMDIAIGTDNPLFMTFWGYHTESDSFPLGDVRKLWSEEGLAKEDAERAKVEAFYKQRVFAAAEQLLEFARKQ
jgi:Protein of unknown function (DUF2489)